MNRKEQLEKNAIFHIEPENDDGNKEYKLKLTDTSEKRIEQMTTQMRFRVDEGYGECIYTIGVTDLGGVIGLTPEEYKNSKDILDIIAKNNNYTISLLSEQKVDSTDIHSKKMYEFLVREHNPKKYVDIKVACTGSVDAGKSSFLGVLLSGQNDDGRGRARLNVFNFSHEVKSGRTSSVAHHIMGFDRNGQVVNYGDSLGRKKTWPDIVKQSSKIITFFDLCGHEKYLKTTILGLTSQFPDLVMVLVGANMGITKMTKEHIFLCLTLKIPFIVIITKIDICKDRQNVMKETVDSVKKLMKLPGVRRIPCDVQSDDDVILAVKNIHSFSTVPLFYVSNVTGEGISHVKQFLNIFNKKQKIEVNENKIEYHIEQTFLVPGVGTVIGGQLIQGTIKLGDKLLLGPNNGSYITVQIKGIHIKRVPVDEAKHGCYVCLALKRIDQESIHRGNVLLSIIDNPVQVWEFEAEVFVLKSGSSGSSQHTTIKIGYEPILHTCSIRQSARILSITDKICSRGVENTKDNILRTGDKANIRFRFCYKSEYVKTGFRLLLAEGSVKIIGKITNIYPENCKIE